MVKKLKYAGFILDRHASGSHEIWWNMTTKKTCTIPHHSEIAAGTCKNILRQMGITETEFKNI